MTKLTRRQWLTGSATIAAGLLIAPTGCATAGNSPAEANPTSNPDLSDWQAVRDQFDADPELIHMAAMLLSTHPESVREAIEFHRRGFDENPVDHLLERWNLPPRARDRDDDELAMGAAADYLGMDAANIALTGNTTKGLAMVYGGLQVRADQEVLTAHWNHWASEGSLQYAAQKKGFEIRRATLFDDIHHTSPDELTERLVDQITAQTRVVAATWVHSNTGLKLPVAQMGRRIDELNQGRAAADQVLFCVDGVHGFGVENIGFADLNCHFFIAGCHKWLFGPRGTGIVAASPHGWSEAVPTTPSFIGSDTPGRRFTPGGFHAFEHRFALAEAFEFHQKIGKERIEGRIHGLADHLIEELSQMDHITLNTPTDPDLRAGIITFEVAGHGTYPVVEHLRDRGIIASTTPGDRRIPRLSPGLLNDHEDIEATVAAVAELA